MTDKEVIKTFEELKRNKEIVKNIDKDFFFEFGETVLNLIQTQQEEIENKDKESHFIQSELDIANAKIIELKRMIDLMAEQLTTPIHSKEWVKEYYENKVETEEK